MAYVISFPGKKIRKNLFHDLRVPSIIMYKNEFIFRSKLKCNLKMNLISEKIS